jgi:antitoxin (DNA-binding transcriptional repressor) of toxin-antitoxin stability system
MKVSAQYAETHLDELLDATERGQVVEIARPNKASVQLTLVPQVKEFDRTGMFGSGKGTIDRTGMVGSGKGTIWYSDDWDTAEGGEEIARLFNESTLFPD